MLLVRSKELKNLNKKIPSNPCLTGISKLLFVILITFQSSFLSAQQDTSDITSPSNIMSVFLSLLVVIAIIFAFAFVMRRFNVTQAGNGQMKVVASLMAGNKEKVMVIEVGDEQHLLGITAQNINHLAKLETPLQTKASYTSQSIDAKSNKPSTQLNFQQKLVQAMADGLSGKGISKNNTGDKHA